MTKLKQFFWLCSGVHIPLLLKCPTDASKYVGIGATIFFTGLFATFAGSFALYTVFDSVWLATAFGIVWGLMIFNLDRYIVSSMRKEGTVIMQFTRALPRIVLAILISVVIAKPLEMKIFDKEIHAELVMMEQQNYSAQETEVSSRFTAQHDRVAAEIKNLKDEVAAKAQQRDALARLAQEEADGTGGTKERNAGPIYKIKKADADQAQAELTTLSERNALLIRDKETVLAKDDSLRSSAITALVHKPYDGPAARMEALDRLTQKSDAIALANWFILLLFIIIETAPLFVKLISIKGPYDHLLKVEEYGFESSTVESLAKMNAAIKERNEQLPTLEKKYVYTNLRF